MNSKAVVRPARGGEVTRGGVRVVTTIAAIKNPVVSLERLSTPIEFNEEYVRRLAQGDATVEQHFTAYFTKLLMAKLRGSIRSEELVKDVCQCTFLRVFERLRKGVGIDHPERLAAFVLGVSNNVLKEMLRKEHQHASFEEGMEPLDERADSSRDLVNDELKRVVTRVMGELSAKDRGILNLLFIEEENKDSICSRFGVDRNYLRVLVFRARGRFRVALQRQGGAAHDKVTPLPAGRGKGATNGS